MISPDEARRLARRIEKAQRRLSRGIDVRKESGGDVSEAAIAERLSQRLKEQSK